MTGGGGFSVMGIVNVTHDSFYDGGRYNDAGAAFDHACRLAGEGAGIIDIGGASTRPGAALPPAEEEAARVLPVIRDLVSRGGMGNIDRGRAGSGPAVSLTGSAVNAGVRISVDTVWASVAEAAVNAGADWINDVSAGRIDPAMPDVAARLGCTVVLAHSRGTPQTMQDDPRYGDVVNEVVDELLSAVDKFRGAGVSNGKIILDPGFGFAKTVEHNAALLRGIDAITCLGYPVLVGLSRKSFIGAVTGSPVDGRLGGTLAATAAAYQNGARIFRAHDVKETVDFLRMLSVVWNGK